MSKFLNIGVKDSVYDPNSRRREVVVRRQPGKSSRYKVNLYLEGEDLPYVRSVTYELHPTFPNRIRTVERNATNPNCKLQIWTWGLFTVKAIVMDKRGQEYVFHHDLSYDQELSSDGGANYAYVS